MNPLSTSYWLSTTSKKKHQSFIPSQIFDVAIVGGGIVGITLAYAFTQAGKKVVIIEAGRILEGVTGHTTAKITSLHTLIYDHLINQNGPKDAKIYAQVQQTAIEKIEAIIQKHHIDCDFVIAPSYTYTQTPGELDAIKSEVSAARSLGLPATFTKKTELPFAIQGAVKFDHQAHFHPLKFLLALSQIITKQGSTIIENLRVTDVKEGEPSTIITPKGEIRARDVVIATNYPILDRGLYHTRLTPRRSYVLGAFINGPVPQGMYISNDEPLFSLRPQPTKKGDMLIVTGFDHLTGQGEASKDYFAALTQITQDKFDLISVDYTWATHDNGTIDRLPYIGKYLPASKHLYVATGFAGWGMTNSMVAADILHDQIMGKTNSASGLFDPARTSQLKAAKQFVKQNLGVGQEFIKGKLPQKNAQVIHQLKKNQGKVIDIDGQKVAVYKNNQGEIQSLSATCQHLGCSVVFNQTETSWDCPCHGSRYDTQGNILHAPTVKPLPKVTLPS